MINEKPAIIRPSSSVLAVSTRRKPIRLIRRVATGLAAMLASASGIIDMPASIGE